MTRVKSRRVVEVVLDVGDVGGTFLTITESQYISWYDTIDSC